MVFSVLKRAARICRLLKIATVLAIPCVGFCTPAAHAHGELLIRIAVLTRQIEGIEPGATNLAHLYLERGELYREDENWSAAAFDYDRAAELDPALPGITLCRARLLTDTGELEPALAMFNRAIAESRPDGNAFIHRARLLVRLGRVAEAIADFRVALERSSWPAPEIFLELAHALESEGKQGEALIALDAGVRKLGPVLALQTRALELELQSRSYDAALARLEVILENAHRKEDWLARRGEVLIQAGRFDHARQSLEAALDAIKLLPDRLQQGRPMVELQRRIRAALAEIANDMASPRKEACGQ